MSTARKRIFAISGSTRAHSTNEALLRFIGERYCDQLELDLFTSLAALPHFNPDVSDDAVDSAVASFRASIARADGVIFCTPEYVFSLPGSLKNAIDWIVSTTVFSDKPVGVIVASGLGEKAFESLVLIMQTVGAKIDGSTLLISGARSKVNASGEVTCEETLQNLDMAIGALISTMVEAEGGVNNRLDPASICDTRF